MADIYECLDACCETENPCVIATIVHVEGSAYRKAGTSMLFMQDGSTVGLLSSGCLEQDLAGHAEAVLESGQSQIVVYHMASEDELSWGVGSGCNGVITILLEPVLGTYKTDLLQLQTYLKLGIAVHVKKRFALQEGLSHISTRFEPDGYPPFGDFDSEQPENGSLFEQQYVPKPRLILFGAGSDARPVARLGSQIGFSVTVADWRPAFCSPDSFPTADQLLLGFPLELMDALDLQSNDYVLVMTHHFQRDQELLHELLTMKLAYLGILGSATRSRKLLADHDVPDWVHTPVGFPIGAEGPEEIAVSIAAQLIAAKRGVRGGLPNEAEHRLRVFGSW